MITDNLKGLISIVLPCLFLLLGGCGSGEEDLKEYIYKIKSRPSRNIEPIPKFDPLPQYDYPEKTVRRSPFKPVQMKSKDEGISAPDRNRRKQPLEEFPLDALKFVGTLKQGSSIWALIQQPGGRISNIKPGQYLGQNYGQVLAITEDSVKIEETVKVAGKWEKKITRLKLNGQSQGAKGA